MEAITRTDLNTKLSDLFTKEAGEPVVAVLGKPSQLLCDVKGRSGFRKVMDFGIAAGLKIVEGDYDPETDMNWVEFSYTAAFCAI